VLVFNSESGRRFTISGIIPETYLPKKLTNLIKIHISATDDCTFAIPSLPKPVVSYGFDLAVAVVSTLPYLAD